MTDKQIKEMEKTLPQWKNGVPPVLTPQQEILKESLSCRDMINSILCYHGTNNIMNNPYLKKYIESLGTILVSQLVDEQIQDFSKAIVLQNVHTDSEGCSYNCIIWHDEQ